MLLLNKEKLVIIYRHVKRAKATKGGIVHPERSEDGWCLIHVCSERQGWVKSLDLEKVIAH